jgi:hypothetical protein
MKTYSYYMGVKLGGVRRMDPSVKA